MTSYAYTALSVHTAKHSFVSIPQYVNKVHLQGISSNHRSREYFIKDIVASAGCKIISKMRCGKLWSGTLWSGKLWSAAFDTPTRLSPEIKHGWVTCRAILSNESFSNNWARRSLYVHLRVDGLLRMWEQLEWDPKPHHFHLQLAKACILQNLIRHYMDTPWKHNLSAFEFWCVDVKVTFSWMTIGVLTFVGCSYVHTKDDG